MFDDVSISEKEDTGALAYFGAFIDPAVYDTSTLRIVGLPSSWNTKVINVGEFTTVSLGGRMPDTNVEFYFVAKSITDSIFYKSLSFTIANSKTADLRPTKPTSNIVTSPSPSPKQNATNETENVTEEDEDFDAANVHVVPDVAITDHYEAVEATAAAYAQKLIAGKKYLFQDAEFILNEMDGNEAVYQRVWADKDFYVIKNYRDGKWTEDTSGVSALKIDSPFDFGFGVKTGAKVGDIIKFFTSDWDGVERVDYEKGQDEMTIYYAPATSESGNFSFVVKNDQVQSVKVWFSGFGMYAEGVTDYLYAGTVPKGTGDGEIRGVVAEITKDQVICRKEPGKQGGMIGKFKKGVKVEAIDSKYIDGEYEWYYVRWNGGSGWVYGEFLEFDSAFDEQ
jgi:hypothetical protein